MSDASFDLKIEELLANRVPESTTKVNNWALNKFSEVIARFDCSTFSNKYNLSQKGGNHFDPLSNSRRKL